MVSVTRKTGEVICFLYKGGTTIRLIPQLSRVVETVCWKNWNVRTRSVRFGHYRLMTPVPGKSIYFRFPIQPLNHFLWLMAQKNRNENPHTTISMLFSFFVFPNFFGQLKFGGYFVIAIKFAEVQNSKKHRGHTLDHNILIHVINSDSSEAQPSYWDRANRCDACPVLPFDCLSAQIEDFNF